MKVFDKCFYLRSEIDSVIFKRFNPGLGQLIITGGLSSFGSFYNFGQRQLSKEQIEKEGLVGKNGMDSSWDTERWQD